MTPTEYTEAVASEVRAALGRYRKTQADLAEVLGVTSATAGRRLSGEQPFDVLELAAICAWLGVPIEQLAPSGPVAAAS